MHKGKKVLLTTTVLAGLNFATPVQAALNDVAVFAPGIDNWMTVQQQNDVADYLTDPGRLPQAQVYNSANQGDLVTWMNSRMSDGKSDVLLIVDLAPGQVFNDNDNSLAEEWMENGNMLIWTGSEPFRSSVNASGTVTDLAADGVNDGANKTLDIKGENLCAGYASTPQQHTSVATSTPGFYNYLPSLNLNYTGSDMRSLSYVDVLTEAENVTTWDDAPNMVIDEMFAENRDLQDTTHVYESDAIVLTMRQNENDRKGKGGQYAQFYCYKGLVEGVDSNNFRKPVLAEFLQNWVAKDINLIWVEAGASGGDGSEDNPYGTIQAGINAADQFSRDRVMVKPGTYNETLVMKQSVKLISAGDDVRGNVVGYLDDFDNPELDFTFNTFPQVNTKKGLTRAQSTIIDGTSLTQAPMVDIPKWATMGTWVDGFSIQNMPEVDQAVCGHAHTIQTRGSSAVIIDNILQNNGGAGLGSYAVFDTNSSGASVEDDSCQNDDFSYANVKYDAHPALINNIISASDGPNLSNNFYAYSILYHNESFKSGYFGDDLPETSHDAPGFGTKHGSHPYIYNNIVYDSSGIGIGAKRGVNELVWANSVDRPTRPIVKNNYVLNSGTADVADSGAGIGARNTGGNDPYSGQTLYHIVDGNFVHTANDAAIGCNYDEDEDGAVTTIPQDSVGYVVIRNNTGTGAGKAGIGIHGSHDIAEVSHNEMTTNTRAGIGIKNNAGVGNITGNFLHSNQMAGIGMKAGAQVASISDNSILSNGLAGIGHYGYNDDGFENKVMVGQESGNTIEWNLAAGIGMQHSEVELMSMNTIRFNALPGITITKDSDVALIEGSASTEGPERVSENGRGDLHHSCTNTVGLVVDGEGSSANISNLIVEKSGRVNIKTGSGTTVTINDSIIRSNVGWAPNVRVDGNASISNCVIEEATAPGLVAGEGAVVSLENTVITKNGTAGISIQGADITSFVGNTISENGTAGIASAAIGGDLFIQSSSIINNGTPGIVIEGLEYDVTIADSNISGNGIGGVRLVNSNIDIRDSIIHNYKGGVIVNDNSVEQASVVTLSNCDLNHPESNVSMHGGHYLNVVYCSLNGMEVHDTDSVFLAHNTLATWNIGILLDSVGWADVFLNSLDARWPVKMQNSSGNIINNLTSLASDGYIFHNSTANFYHNTMYGGDSKANPNKPGDNNQFGIIANHDAVVYAYNNIITGTQFGIQCKGNSTVHADNNLLWGCQFKYHTWDGTGTLDIGDNNLEDVDPQLVDPMNGDYHLSNTSPCINAGDSGIPMCSWEDIDGESRPVNGRDIGADEAF